MSKKIKSSALREQKGVSVPETTNKVAVKSIKEKRLVQPSTDALVKDIIDGNMTALSRAITLIESTNSDHLTKGNTIIQQCLPYANNSIRIGITGVPGVGKSTFIDVFGSYLTSMGKKLAVLAIDPSSAISMGSILGGKTRMENLARDPNAFVRPSPAAGSLGGVTRATREAILLCEAAGFDYILIETVGVGQSEVAVHSMVDFFLLLMLAGAGDELQGIKKGIMEMADGIAINKADGDNERKAQQAKVEYEAALHLLPSSKSGWQTKVLTCSAITKAGIPAIAEMTERYALEMRANGWLLQKRKRQAKAWLHDTIGNLLLESFFEDPEVAKSLSEIEDLVEAGKIPPTVAAANLIALYLRRTTNKF